jgi:PilZ domain
MIRKERRRSKRISTNVAVSWTTSDFSQGSRVTDLSTEGCFIQTALRMTETRLSLLTQVPKKNAIYVKLHLSHDERLKLNGEVVYEIERLGFGVRFLDVSTPDEKILRAFIDRQELGSLELPFPRVRGHKH